MNYVHRKSWLLGLMTTALLPVSALAQQETRADADIIVTAQKREQALHDVPVAITAVGAAELEKRRLFNVDQLSNIAPNVTIEQGNTASSSLQVAIRGGVTTNIALAEDPAVGIYLDGVYVGRSAGAVFDVPDLERIEVLRGPQGALFGRNTLAGAINLVIRKPSNEWRMEAEASYGNYDYKTLRALVNVPLSDSLFVKLSGQLQKRDGFSQAVPDPFALFSTVTGDMDNLNRKSLLAQVRWQPSDRLTIDYSYQYSHAREHPMSALHDVAAGGMFDPASAFYIPTMPADLYIVPGDNRPKELSIDARVTDDARIHGHALNIELEIGSATLRSITGYRDVNIDQGALGLDVDGTPLPLALGGLNSDVEQFSQEFQLVGKTLTDKLHYVLGGYFFKDNAQSFNPQGYFFGGNVFDTRGGIRTKAVALFAHLDYELNDQITLTGGLRWTHERKQLNRFYQIQALTPNPGLELPLTTIDIRKSDNIHDTFSNFSPTLVLSYAPTDALNLYAKYAVGFRSGSFNAEAATDADVRQSYDPEKNESFELGLKSQLLDRRLNINIAAFYNRQKDKQVAVLLTEGTSGTVNRNAGRANVYGLEVELDARPFDALRLHGSLGLLRTDFKEYLDLNSSGLIVNVADNRSFAKAPRTTLTAGADLTLHDSARAGQWVLSGDLKHQGKVFALPVQNKLDPTFPLVATGNELEIPSQTTMNARLRWDAGETIMGLSNVYAMLWVHNLTNYRKVNNKLTLGPNFGGLVLANYHPPRTYGLTVGFKY